MRLDENELVKQNIGLVRSIVHKFNPKDQCQFDDLVQVGLIGLLKAIRKHDENAGQKLSTFAVKSIRWSIINELNRSGRPLNTSPFDEPYKEQDSLDFLDGFTELEQQIIVLHYVEKIPASTIRKSIKISRSLFDKTTQNIKQKIQESYDPILS